MNIFNLFHHRAFRTRGDLTAPGQHIIAGVVPPVREELPPFDEAVQAMRSFCLPCAGNIVNLEYHRSQRRGHVATPPRDPGAHQGSPSAPSNTAGSPSLSSFRAEPGCEVQVIARPGSDVEGA